MSIADEVRRYWDVDSVGYDAAPHHHPTGTGEVAAWVAALATLLPRAPSRVLDCGAGTGFLTLMAARLGHRVTALDLSAGMLERLRIKAEAGGLEIEVIEGPAEEPPIRDFDVVIERHLLWTLPDPVTTLRAWRDAAPAGRLVLFEGLWGAVDPLERLRRRAQDLLIRAISMQAPASGHHAEYPQALRDAMPLGSGTTPDALAAVAADAGWSAPRLHRLRDVEWEMSCRLPLPVRLLGVAPRFAIVAGS